jgi:glycosyltransferase EpsJ
VESNVNSGVKLSIVVPFYNNHDDVARLASRFHHLINCDLNKEITAELLFIDDGSKTSQEYDFDKFSSERLAINLCRQSNGGVSSARNLGLDKSIGEYVTFLDSDDDVHDDFFQNFYRDIINNKEKYDIYAFNYSVVKNGSSINRGPKENLEDKKYSYLSSLLMKESYFHICSYIFNRSFLLKSNVKLVEDIYLSEDVLFVLECLINSRTVGVFYSINYKYIDNQNSVINSDLGLKELNHIEAFKKINGINFGNLYKQKNFFLITCVMNMLIRTLRRHSMSKKNKYIILKNIFDFYKNIGPSKIHILSKRGLAVLVFKVLILLKLNKLILKSYKN